MQSPPADWKKIDPEITRLILSQGEKHLESQLASGIAADQRATTVATILIGVVTAMLAATIGHWSAEHDCSILTAGLSASFFMLAGTSCCLWSARPVDFWYPGGQPKNWWDAADGNLPTLLGGETENYQQNISENESVLRANSTWMKYGFILSALSPIVGAVAWLSSGLFCPAFLSMVSCLALV